MFGEPAARQAAQGWRVVWADEFDRDGLPDPAKWIHDVGGHGWGNNELQFYTMERSTSWNMSGSTRV
jgi:hypothetical protein